MSLKAGENVVLMSNSLDLDKTASYSKLLAYGTIVMLWSLGLRRKFLMKS